MEFSDITVRVRRVWFEHLAPPIGSAASECLGIGSEQEYVEILGVGKKSVIINYYNPCRRLELNHAEETEGQDCSNIACNGDLSAHNTLWGSGKKKNINNRSNRTVTKGTEEVFRSICRLLFKGVVRNKHGSNIGKLVCKWQDKEYS